MISVEKVQVETTFDVINGECSYTVVVMEDYQSNTIHWDIMDDAGDMVEDEDLISEIVNIIEANIN
jgi:hypothetical protein